MLNLDVQVQDLFRFSRAGTARLHIMYIYIYAYMSMYMCIRYMQDSYLELKQAKSESLTNGGLLLQSTGVSCECHQMAF